MEQHPVDEGRLKDIFYKDYGGSAIQKCQQCGTCSASCPMAPEMDFGPRRLFALVQAGAMLEALRADTFWFCVSCYGCTVRCPREIPVADLMYGLKNLALAQGLARNDARANLMYDSFSRVVHRFGRVTEPLVMAWYGLSRPLEALGQAGLGLKLLVRGRLDILPQKIKMPETIRRLLAEEDR